ncbi:hypothetical protein CP061683_0549 [Chlamydia psittaci 06-1683]|nr:hypothetical protein CP061683_0549 [Chlamydia psittaci 06-1683]
MIIRSIQDISILFLAITPKNKTLFFIQNQLFILFTNNLCHLQIRKL